MGCFWAALGCVSAPGLQLRGAVPPKEHNHKVSGNSDTDHVHNLDLHAFTASTIAAALACVRVGMGLWLGVWLGDMEQCMGCSLVWPHTAHCFHCSNCNIHPVIL